MLQYIQILIYSCLPDKIENDTGRNIVLSHTGHPSSFSSIAFEFCLVEYRLQTKQNVLRGAIQYLSSVHFQCVQYFMLILFYTLLLAQKKYSTRPFFISYLHQTHDICAEDNLLVRLVQGALFTRQNSDLAWKRSLFFHEEDSFIELILSGGATFPFLRYLFTTSSPQLSLTILLIDMLLPSVGLSPLSNLSQHTPLQVTLEIHE